MFLPRNAYQLLQLYSLHQLQLALTHKLCTYQLFAPLSPLGHWVGMGRDLTTPVINYPTLWAGEVIKSSPMTLVPHRGLCRDLIIQISKYFLFRKSFQG